MKGLKKKKKKKKLEEVDAITRKAILNDLIAGLDVSKVSKKYKIIIPSHIRVVYKCALCKKEFEFNVFSKDARYLSSFITCPNCGKETAYATTTTNVMDEEEWWVMHWGIEK